MEQKYDFSLLTFVMYHARINHDFAEIPNT